MNTRGLQSLVSSRIADATCLVTYNRLTFNDDGSSVNVPEIVCTRGSVAALQPHDIQRLREGGLVVRNGVSIVLHDVPAERADVIQSHGIFWRVLSWTFIRAYDEYNEFVTYDEYDEYTTPYGTAVAMCDEIVIGAGV